MIPKFRVFDSKFKEMEEVYLIDWQWPEQDAWINDNPSDDLIFMQSTGLHDNTKFENLSEKEKEEWLESGKSADEWQGREIFEGDIVEIIYDREPFIGVVVYDLGETDFKATNNREDYGNNFQYLTVGESIEVIGDIYQNTELLEGV